MTLECNANGEEFAPHRFTFSQKPWLGPPPPGFPRQQRGSFSAADSEMRSRQMRYDTLGPQEQQEQNKWVIEQINIGGVCPAGYGWNRDHQGKRFICRGNAHVITDEDLAQGRPPQLLSSRDSWYSRGDSGRRRTGWERLKSKKKKKKSTWW